MSEKYDGWIAKDKYGNYWLGTFSAEKWGCETSIKKVKDHEAHGFKFVKVKLVEVE